jgi:hypothetical protein
VVSREALEKVKNIMTPALAGLPTRTDAFGLYGAMAPIPSGFDPLGLHKVDVATLKRYREVS